MLNDIARHRKRTSIHLYTLTHTERLKELSQRMKENCNQMMLTEVTEKLANKHKISVRTISRVLQNTRVTKLKTITMFQSILKAFVYFETRSHYTAQAGFKFKIHPPVSATKC